MKRLLLILAIAFLPGCAALEFGGDEDRAWDFRWGWNQAGVSDIGEPDPENPEFDEDGNLIPDADVTMTYQFPDVTAGYTVVMGSERSRTTPTMGVEAFEFKVPYLRWFSTQAMVGNDLVGVYVGKRFTSIYEVTGGVFYGRDQESDEETWGLSFTLLKF